MKMWNGRSLNSGKFHRGFMGSGNGLDWEGTWGWSRSAIQVPGEAVEFQVYPIISHVKFLMFPRFLEAERPCLSKASRTLAFVYPYIFDSIPIFYRVRIPQNPGKFQLPWPGILWENRPGLGLERKTNSCRKRLADIFSCRFLPLQRAGKFLPQGAGRGLFQGLNWSRVGMWGGIRTGRSGGERSGELGMAVDPWD